jgi:hypothetical protein
MVDRHLDHSRVRFDHLWSDEANRANDEIVLEVPKLELL